MLRTALLALVLAAAAAGCGHKFVPEETAHIEAHGPAVGGLAPDATLVTASGTKVALADVLAAQPRTIVVWYRGFY